MVQTHINIYFFLQFTAQPHRNVFGYVFESMWEKELLFAGNVKCSHLNESRLDVVAEMFRRDHRTVSNV